jgi:hypothetical protein
MNDNVWRFVSSRRQYRIIWVTFRSLAWWRQVGLTFKWLLSVSDSLSLKLFHKIELSLFHTMYKYYVQHVCEVGLASLSLLESVVVKKGRCAHCINSKELWSVALHLEYGLWRSIRGFWLKSQSSSSLVGPYWVTNREERLSCPNGNVLCSRFSNT